MQGFGFHEVSNALTCIHGYLIFCSNLTDKIKQIYLRAPQFLLTFFATNFLSTFFIVMFIFTIHFQVTMDGIIFLHFGEECFFETKGSFQVFWSCTNLSCSLHFLRHTYKAVSIFSLRCNFLIWLTFARKLLRMGFTFQIFFLSPD